MIKVTLLLGALFVLSTAALLRTSEPELVEGCESETELWGSDDGTVYFLCIGDNMALKLPCDPGTFFVSNSTVSGCVPLADVDSSCVYQGEVQTCEGENLRQPQPHIDPTKYYLCPSEGATPVALTCLNNMAFARQDGYLGCFEWAQWRQIRGCTN